MSEEREPIFDSWDIEDYREEIKDRVLGYSGVSDAGEARYMIHLEKEQLFKILEEFANRLEERIIKRLEEKKILEPKKELE